MAVDISAPEPGKSSAGSLSQLLRKPSQEQIVLLITLALLIAFGASLPGFATVTNLGILGLGMGLIVISRGIDLSEVAIMAGSWCIALLENHQGLPIFWSVIL